MKLGLIRVSGLFLCRLSLLVKVMMVVIIMLMMFLFMIRFEVSSMLSCFIGLVCGFLFVWWL